MTVFKKRLIIIKYMSGALDHPDVLLLAVNVDARAATLKVRALL